MGIFDIFRKIGGRGADGRDTGLKNGADYNDKSGKKNDVDARIKSDRDKEIKIEVEVEEEKPETEIFTGWDAITEAFERVYPTQKNPRHYATLLKWSLGGKDPLDGISIYDGGDYWHFVTYGLTELYEKESENKEISGYGMEFTLKLKKGAASGGTVGNSEAEEAEIRCVCGILQAIAKLTFTNGEMFLPDEYIYTGQTKGIDANAISDITGFITISDKDVPPVDTPNGKVVFVEFIGATDAELKAIHNRDLTVAELYQSLGTDVTSYDRKSIIPADNGASI